MEFSFSAYVDARLILPMGERSWLDGGEGKLRFGGSSPQFRFVEAVGEANLSLTPDVSAITVLRVEPKQRSGVDLLEGYLAWRPKASGDWQWSAKAGAFFPAISVENDDLGWASPYTLTPSAINSWVGEELRTIGSEATLSRHGNWGTVSAVGALICCNELAGVLMADRGWALDDRPTGLFERIRTPDATAQLFGGHGPHRTGEFENIDGNVGWYAGLRWDVPDFGRLAVLRYDNEANAYASNEYDSSWWTRFWSASIKTHWNGVTLLAQALRGDTSIGNHDALATTRFASAFLLASYDMGDWRLSARAETFQTRTAPSFKPLNEDGGAMTIALIWSAQEWLRLSAEAIAIDSRRTERLIEGHSPVSAGEQFQLGARFFI